MDRIIYINEKVSINTTQYATELAELRDGTPDVFIREKFYPFEISFPEHVKKIIGFSYRIEELDTSGKVADDGFISPYPFCMHLYSGFCSPPSVFTIQDLITKFNFLKSDNTFGELKLEINRQIQSFLLTSNIDRVTNGDFMFPPVRTGIPKPKEVLLKRNFYELETKLEQKTGLKGFLKIPIFPIVYFEVVGPSVPGEHTIYPFDFSITFCFKCLTDQ